MKSPYVRLLCRTLALGAAIGWMIFILNISSQSGQDIEQGIEWLWWLGQSVSVIGHLVIYAILAIFYVLNIFVWVMNSAFKVKWLSIVILLSGLFAIFDEIQQSSVAGRYGSIQDVLVDVIGAIGVVILCKLTWMYRNNRHIKQSN